MSKQVTLRVSRTALFSAGVCIALGLGGCSNRAVYESVQINQKNECQKLPAGEYEKCMERHDMDFDEYQREREKVLKEDK